MAAETTDYADRLVDAWGYSGGYTGELTADLFSGMVCGGILKLSQRWVIAFLTETGSMPYRPDWGTSFLTRLRAGELRTEADVASAFLLAVDELAASLAEEETDATPDDERYASSDLLSVGLEAGRLTVSVRIYSAAGDSRSILVPVPGSDYSNG